MISARCSQCGVDLSGPRGEALQAVEWRLHALRIERQTLIDQLRRSPAGTHLGAEPPPADAPAAAWLPPPSVASAGAPWPHSRPATPVGPGTSLQNVLLTLGTGLLAIAAIVFTAVNWSHLGAMVQGATLVTMTALALGAAMLAGRRNMQSTAEALAAVTVVFAAVDAHALRVGAIPGTDALTFWGVALAILAMVAWAVGTLTATRRPRLAAVLAAQVPLPLFVVGHHVDVPLGSLACLAQTVVVAVAVRRAGDRAVDEPIPQGGAPGRAVGGRPHGGAVDGVGGHAVRDRPVDGAALVGRPVDDRAIPRRPAAAGLRWTAAMGGMVTWFVVTALALNASGDFGSKAARSVVLLAAAAVAGLVCSLWCENDEVRPPSLALASAVGLGAAATAATIVFHGDARWLAVAAVAVAVVMGGVRLPRRWGNIPTIAGFFALAAAAAPVAGAIGRAAIGPVQLIDRPWRGTATASAASLLDRVDGLPSGRSIAVIIGLVAVAALAAHRRLPHGTATSALATLYAAAVIVTPVAAGWSVRGAVGVLLAGAALPLIVAGVRSDVLPVRQAAVVAALLIVVGLCWATVTSSMTIAAALAVVVIAVVAVGVDLRRGEHDVATVAAASAAIALIAIPGLVSAAREATPEQCWLMVALTAAAVSLIGLVLDRDGTREGPRRMVSAAVELTAGVAHLAALALIAGRRDADPLMIGLAAGATVAAVHATRPGRRWVAGWAAAEGSPCCGSGWRRAGFAPRRPTRFRPPRGCWRSVGGWSAVGPPRRG